MRYQFLRFPEGRAKAVTLSYDDGCPQDIRFADIISSYQMKATFNLNGSGMQGEGALSKEAVMTHILSKGHEIAVHGSFHQAPGLVRPIEAIRDVLDCRLELESTYGILVRGMAYPDSGILRFLHNSDYAAVKQYLTNLDIVYARTLGGDNNAFALPEDWHCWTPTAHHDNPHVLDYAHEFLSLDISTKTYTAARYPRLFYLWGHSFEFEQKDNWDHLHKLCDTLAGKEDIWYATNMEIYQYVTAYRSLIYSADGRTIYNPTLLTLWFDRGGVLYAINPGEQLTV